MGKTGGKGISYFGLVAMGIGCMLGTSWLLLTGTWLETAGGPLNLVVAFALCIIIELPFAFAYMEAIPMLPLPGGEVVYSYAAFGSSYRVLQRGYYSAGTPGGLRRGVGGHPDEHHRVLLGGSGRRLPAGRAVPRPGADGGAL